MYQYVSINYLSGLFSEVGLKFVDEEGREGEPTLAEMTAKAVEMLSKVRSIVAILLAGFQLYRVTHLVG